MTSHWIKHEHLFSGIKYECDNCGAEFDAAYEQCPNCGCDMRNRTKYSPDFVDECEFMDLFS